MSTTTERELDNLITTLSHDLNNPGSHRSRYYSTYSSASDVSRNRYSNRSPYQPYRNTQKKGWYKEISKEMGTPRSITPILKQNVTPKTFRPISASSRSISPRSHSPASRSASRPQSPRYFTSSPPRSVSPRREKNVVIGPVTEMVTKQEYFRHRDSRHGKPLPGSSDFMRTSWPYGLDDVLNKEKRREPSGDHLRAPPANEWSSDGRRSGRDLHSTPSVEDLVSYYQRFANRNRSPSPTGSRRAQSASAGITEVPVRRVTSHQTSTSVPSSPVPKWLKNLKHIVIEDVHVPVPPKFGTLAPRPRFPDRAEPPPELGPPCELCHKPITEKRCIITENFKYHCWHFVCHFCSKTLQENDFLMAVDNKPYCNNCYKRAYP